MSTIVNDGLKELIGLMHADTVTLFSGKQVGAILQTLLIVAELEDTAKEAAKEEAWRFRDGGPKGADGPSGAEPKAYVTMTPEEYDKKLIIGWHSVCRDVDGTGNTGVRLRIGA